MMARVLTLLFIGSFLSGALAEDESAPALRLTFEVELLTTPLTEDGKPGPEARLAKATNKVLLFLPEDRRKGFASRMDKVWDHFLIHDLGGMKMLEGEK